MGPRWMGAGNGMDRAAFPRALTCSKDREVWLFTGPSYLVVSKLDSVEMNARARFRLVLTVCRVLEISNASSYWNRF